MIIGQARSGTTFVQTLMNAHPDILCRGELFDAWQIDHDGRKDTRLDAVRARDADPSGFLLRFLAGEGLRRKPAHIGFKMLTQHHPRLLPDIIPAHPDMPIIHVSRDNKLAQFASNQQVKKNRPLDQHKRRCQGPPA